MKFSEITYRRPDLDAVFASFDRLAKGIAEAQSAEKAAELYREFEKESAHLATAMTVAESATPLIRAMLFTRRKKSFLTPSSPSLPISSSKFTKRCWKARTAMRWPKFCRLWPLKKWKSTSKRKRPKCWS